MLADILWPVVLLLVYVLLFGIVLYLTWRFTRGFDNTEPAHEEHDGSQQAPLDTPQGGQGVVTRL